MTLVDATALSTQSEAKTPVHQSVYAHLREMILFGDLAPGQQVTIQGLTEHLGAGMTPVREALRRLTAEGALVLQNNRRVTVPKLSSTGLEELGFMRETLETELTRRAVERPDPLLLAKLEKIDQKLNLAIQQGDITGYLTLNYRFHAALYARADAPIIAATVDRLWLRFGPSLRVVCGRFGTQNLPDKHADFLQAYQQGDDVACIQAIREDVQQGQRQMQAALAGEVP